MYSLEVYGLTKKLGDMTIVKEVSFAVQPGESFAILGPAESGKTTLLRLISGLEIEDEGRIVLNGENITGFPASKRHMSIVLQNGYGLVPHMGVFESIAMPLQTGSMSKETRGNVARQLVSLVAQTLQIQHLLDRKVGTLSKGEQLRVAMARGLVKNPQMLLFDDPLINMDTPTRLTARREILDVHRTTRIPYIFMTRDQPEAFALAERIAVINQGEIQQIGTRAELFNEPATLWVAQWLGFPPMNTITGYLQGTYQPDGMRYRVWAKSMTPLLPLKWTSVLSHEKCVDILLGIRPEEIIPEWEFQEKLQPSFYRLEVGVLASEWHQGKTLVQLQLPHVEDKFMAVFDISHDKVRLGQMLTVALDPERFCLFHPRTQQLLRAPVVTSSVGKNRNNTGHIAPHYRSGELL